MEFVLIPNTTDLVTRTNFIEFRSFIIKLLTIKLYFATKYHL